MPSTLPGFQSGGQPLVSGNPFSGVPVPLTGIRVKLTSTAASGLTAFVGVALGLSSGGITLSSGGAFSSGGVSDGYELGAGQDLLIPRGQCSGRIDKIHVLVPAAQSGVLRLFWNVE